MGLTIHNTTNLFNNIFVKYPKYILSNYTLDIRLNCNFNKILFDQHLIVWGRLKSAKKQKKSYGPDSMERTLTNDSEISNSTKVKLCGLKGPNAKNLAIE